MEEFESESVFQPCSESKEHQFCQSCLRDWCLEAKIHRRKLNCPICRTVILENYDSIMEGESRHYFYSHPEKIKKILNYRKGKFHGPQFYYFQHTGPENYLEIALHYDEGELDGIQRKYHNTYRKKKGEVTLKNNLLKESPYQKGLCHGICREWHLNGKLKKEYRMENGILQGEYKVYNGRGTLFSMTMFEAGIMKEMVIEGTKLDYSDMVVP